MKRILFLFLFFALCFLLMDKAYAGSPRPIPLYEKEEDCKVWVRRFGISICAQKKKTIAVRYSRYRVRPWPVIRINKHFRPSRPKVTRVSTRIKRQRYDIVNAKEDRENKRRRIRRAQLEFHCKRVDYQGDKCKDLQSE